MNIKLTSAADRRRQQRYEKIVRRKEENWDYDQEKKKRRMERKLEHTRIVALDFSKLEGHSLPAVLCTTREKAKHLLSEAERQGLPNLWACTDDCWRLYKERTVYVLPRGNWGSKLILHADINTAMSAGCCIIPYEDLLPPPDYGDIECTLELSMLFGG